MSHKYLYCCFIEGHQKYGDHIKLGYSKNPYRRYENDKLVGRSSIIRTIPIGDVSQSDAIRQEQMLIRFIDKKAEAFGINTYGLKPTFERYYLRGGAGQFIITWFGRVADKIRAAT